MIRLVMAVLLVACALPVSATSVLSLSDAFSLTVSLQADRRVYSRNDAVDLQTRITNTSSHEIQLARDICGAPLLLSLRVLDSDGRENSGAGLPQAFCLGMRANPGTQGFIALKPGKSYLIKSKISASDLAHHGPGEYFVQLEYQGYAYENWSPRAWDSRASAIPTSEPPTLRSRKVRITIRP